MVCPLPDICRLCANSSAHLLDAFSPEGEAILLERKIRMCLPITVSAEDDMPKKVCFSCRQKLETAYELYRACNSAQATIKRLLRIHCPTNSQTIPKTCFIEQCERSIGNESGEGTGSLDNQIPASTSTYTRGQTPGKPVLVKAGFIGAGSLSSGPASSNFSMSTQVVNLFQSRTSIPPPVQPNSTEVIRCMSLSNSSPIPAVNQHQPVGQIRPADPQPVGIPDFQSTGQVGSGNQMQLLQCAGQIRPASAVQPPSVGSVEPRPAHPGQFQPVGSVRSIQRVQSESTGTPITTHPVQFQSQPGQLPGPQCVGQVRPAQPAQPIEQVDSKEHILLNTAQVNDSRTVTAPPKEKKRKKGNSKSASGKASQISKGTISGAPQTCEETSNRVGVNNNDPIIPQPLLAVCDTQHADDNSAEAATAVAALLNQDSDTGHFDPSGDDGGDVEQIHIIQPSATPVSKRPKLKTSDVEVACRYCKKIFSEDFITHHENLHLRRPCFSCVACDKNFTTAIGLERHKCESGEPGT